MYIRLFHGRNDPDQDMDDWGFDGPIIGDVGVTWTYGSLKLHSLNNDDFIDLPIHDDMVVFGGKYYGDFELIEKQEFENNCTDQKHRVKSFKTAIKIITADKRKVTN